MPERRLFERLAELENEYRAGLERELRKLASGHGSRYFSRKIPGLFDGRYWRSQDAARLEKLEHEIASLRLKLGESSPGPLVSIARRFERERSDAKDRRDGGEAWIARQCLAELEAGAE